MCEVAEEVQTLSCRLFSTTTPAQSSVSGSVQAVYHSTLVAPSVKYHGPLQGTQQTLPLTGRAAAYRALAAGAQRVTCSASGIAM